MTNDKSSGSRPPWWKGERGEWYVVVQLGLLLLVAVGPRNWPSWPAWSGWWVACATLAGGVFLLAGGVLVLSGAVALGAGLTPLPRPKDDAALVERGPYRLVRHPIYSGLVLMALGWGLCVHGGLTLGYALALLVLLDAKASREEAWLSERFPRYAAYRQRVRKLIPFVY